MSFSFTLHLFSLRLTVWLLDPALTHFEHTPINNRQQLAEYQASLPVYAAKTTVYTGVQQIHNRQELAEYQATLR